ncbi:site-specific integrase [uncultured Thiodictyon sp.]|uniref:tyrosine-type recombinase/integrase n=1 Tax=uncultured Thiodictyon sp. TaxID=1846217 RepID=UPI0025DAC875|nr:site-specific integrase [uncultured Thiodictyon sp.]
MNTETKTEGGRALVNLTKRSVEGMTYEGTGRNPDYRWDPEVKGFGVRVYPTGLKTFLIAYRSGARKRFLKLGTLGKDMTAEQARAAAKTKLGAVVQGADPAESRDQDRQGETVRELCVAYLERYAKVHKKSWSEDERRINNRILPAWASLKAKAIKRADVAALHSKIGTKEDHPYEANRVRELVAKMFELAHRWGFVPEDHRNPAQGIDDYKETKRDRWVTPDELPRLAQAINEEPNESARAALWLYLLTGCRKSELLKAQWADVDWTREALRLADTKNGKTHYIPLSPPAVALLRDMPRTDDNPFILPGKLPGAHLVNVSKPWGRVRAAAGVEDVRLHDLRRTVGSWLAQSGNSLHLIGRVLNHSTQSTTAVYARFGEDSVRAALDQHGARLMGAAGLTPTAEVTELPARARTAAK